MKDFFFRCIVKALKQIIGLPAYQRIEGEVQAAEHLLGFDGTRKREYVLGRLNWLIADLRKGAASRILREAAHIMVAVAIDIAVAQAKLEK